MPDITGSTDCGGKKLIAITIAAEMFLIPEAKVTDTVSSLLREKRRETRRAMMKPSKR